MATSFQNEIPKARINITLDVDTQGARQKKELPLKLLMLGDFSHGNNPKPSRQRSRITINKENFNQVLADVEPRLNTIVANKLKPDSSELPIKLAFKHINDFLPEQVATQIPEINKLIAMRNLIKDLKANILDNAGFRKALEKLMHDQTGRQRLSNELKKLAPLS